METPTLQSLQEQVTKLQNELNALRGASTIPMDVEVAFKNRIADLVPIADAVAVTAIGGAAAFNLPNVTGLIKVKINGKYYKVLYQ